jgi:hypothetical protein
MKEARESGIKELKSFVAGIERDYDEVRAHHEHSHDPNKSFPLDNPSECKYICYISIVTNFITIFDG